MYASLQSKQKHVPKSCIGALPHRSAEGGCRALEREYEKVISVARPPGGMKVHASASTTDTFCHPRCSTFCRACLLVHDRVRLVRTTQIVHSTHCAIMRAV